MPFKSLLSWNVLSPHWIIHHHLKQARLSGPYCLPQESVLLDILGRDAQLTESDWATCLVGPCGSNADLKCS